MTNYPERFDSTTLSLEDRKVLEEFEVRRSKINQYLRMYKVLRFTCPACAFPTLLDQGGFEVCAVCDWEDDGQDDEDADDILGGPNGKLSLTEYRVATGYMLRTIVHDKKGVLVSDPKEILEIIASHVERMDKFLEENSLNVEQDHPVWDEWKKESAKLKTDLIKTKDFLN
jgi:uncharacterized Zn finger protein (UPF0148 family)